MKRKSFAQFEQDFYIDQSGLKSPKDGAVFYTNNAREAAEAYVADRRALGKPATTLEQTEYGRKFDADIKPYWKGAASRRNIALPATELVSKRYAEGASGQVEVFCDRKVPWRGGVFARVESETLIYNEKVTQINGVRREDLKAIRDRGDPNAERDTNRMIGLGDRLRGNPKREKTLEKLQARIEREAARRETAARETAARETAARETAASETAARKGTEGEARRARLEEERRRALAPAARRASAQVAPAAESTQPDARKAAAPEAGRRGPDAASKAKTAAPPPLEATPTASPQAAREEAVSAGRRRFNEKFDRCVGRGKERDTRGKNTPAGR